MTLKTIRRAAVGAAATLAASVALVACTTATDRGSPSSGHETIASCPSNGIATTIGTDATGSGLSAEKKAADLAIIANHVRRTALCGGHLGVFAFASSTGSTVTVFDDDLQVKAPTDNARNRKAEKLAEHTIATITENYDSALANVSGSGTDILGMLTLLQQANAQFPDFTAENVLLTDGWTNIGVDPTTVVDTAAARALADQQTVPDLSGASLKIIGIGKQAEGELPSAVIANVTAFWEQICANTNAASCQVSTEGR